MGKDKNLSELQLDAVGEIMNISMGSAATAVSELLDAKVWITTPEVSVKKVRDLNYGRLEPAICVKIVYIKGITGSNLMILKQDDVQLILNQLMGQPLTLSPDFEFDDLNISAVSEVMNQMMGASATALSEFLSKQIDISTPTPYILEDVSLADLQDLKEDEDIVAINFDLTIDGVIKSEFISVMDLNLAQGLADTMMQKMGVGAEPEPIAEPVKQTPPTPQPVQSAQPAQTNQPTPAPQPIPQAPTANLPNMQNMPNMTSPMGAMGAMEQMPMQTPYQPYPQQYQQPYPAQYQQQYPQQSYGYPTQPQTAPINVQNAHLHQFENFDVNLTGDQKDNLQLLMGVPLQISVEIGTARKKVKEILEFTQGTIIELERQAGAPVDVIVNGNLIARGDVVVIDDNFAVRITEIVKSKFMDTLGKE